MLTEIELTNHVIQWVRERSASKGESTADITADSDLLATGLVDSLGFLNLLLFIESHEGCSTNLLDADPRDFAVVGRLCRLAMQGSKTETKPDTRATAMQERPSAGQFAGLSTNVFIRLAGPDDLPNMERIIREFSPGDAVRARRDLKGETYVAVAGGKIIGVTGIIPDDLSARVCWLGWTYFDSEYCGHDRGEKLSLRTLRLWSRLLRHVEEIVSQRGQVLFMTTSTHPAYARAIRFYELHGYAIAGILPGYYENGIDLVALYRPTVRTGANGAAPDGASPRDLYEQRLQVANRELVNATSALNGFAAIFQSGRYPITSTETLTAVLEDAFRLYDIAGSREAAPKLLDRLRLPAQKKRRNRKASR